MILTLNDRGGNDTQIEIDLSDPHFAEKMKAALEEHDIKQTEFYKALKEDIK